MREREMIKEGLNEGDLRDRMKKVLEAADEIAADHVPELEVDSENSTVRFSLSYDDLEGESPEERREAQERIERMAGEVMDFIAQNGYEVEWVYGDFDKSGHGDDYDVKEAA